ncbi:transcriptional regulator [Salinivibrio kushneri]|uniref:NadS family protein n=1 Tax=Salinivibrio TaxID=51366 RepID=UPI000988E02C|nr:MULTISPECIES: NadS family protein [Salinivibrio]OOE32090.1 transcriptional regulator [Salinivibrio kushneri]OOE77822.1 transcriptional regulator [Salinivibrio sp. IB870]
MSIFTDLKTSLEEAVEIKKENMEPSRITSYTIEDVKAIREDILNVSRSEFAKAMSVSVETVKSWENKRRNPSGLAAKVLHTIKDNPEFYKALEAH